MASDDTQWVEDVRRWVASRTRAGQDAADSQIGYEAADPVLQAQHWPDALAQREPSGPAA